MPIMRRTERGHATNYVGDSDKLQVRRQGGHEVEIVQEWPPRREEIEETFGKLPDGVVFAWGDKIMVPGGYELSPWLIDHEVTHLEQQEAFGGVDRWWDHYLTDVAFRLSQELEAHIAEWTSFCKYASDRNMRARYLNDIAGRLSSKMYGSMISRGEAMKMIRRGT